MSNLSHPLLPLTNDDIVNYIMPHIKAHFKNEDVYTILRKQANQRVDDEDNGIKIGEYLEYE